MELILIIILLILLFGGGFGYYRGGYYSRGGGHGVGGILGAVLIVVLKCGFCAVMRAAFKTVQRTWSQAYDFHP